VNQFVRAARRRAADAGGAHAAERLMWSRATSSRWPRSSARA
jgi:hypothetical protein